MKTHTLIVLNTIGRVVATPIIAADYISTGSAKNLASQDGQLEYLHTLALGYIVSLRSVERLKMQFNTEQGYPYRTTVT
jgi:hypothetical protein